MASITQRSFPTKQLGQLLQEQQEPFKLEVYLLERGYSKKSSQLAHFGSTNSSKFSKSDTNKRKQKIIPSCSKISRASFNKLASVKKPQPIDQNVDVIKTGKSSQENNAEDERFSSASSTTVFNSCSESDTDSSQKGQVATDRKYKWIRMEDKQQLSPVSVLEETLSISDNSPILDGEQRVMTRKEEISTVCSNNVTTKKVNTIFSVSLSKLLEHSSTEKRTIHKDIISSKYMKIKTQLRQTQQLLFDCVREVIEIYTLKNRRQQLFKEFLGAEEIGRLLHENVLEWSKQSTKDGDNTTAQLLNCDLLASFEEWDDIQEQKKEIAMVIGDFISEDIIIEFVIDHLSRLKAGPSQIR